MSAVFIGIGVVIGIAITMLIFKAFIVGTLRVDRSDPTDNPYLFLELSREMSDVSSKKYVILKVNNRNYISHK